MKKFLAYLILLSLMIISLSACKPKDETPAIKPPPPTTLGVELRADAGNEEITLYWPMVAGANTYNIYMGTSYSSLTKITTIPATLVSAPYTVTTLADGSTPLTNGMTYYFAFSAVNASNGEGDLSYIIPATPSAPPLPPEFPKNVRANAGNTTVTVSWTPVTDADHYNLYCTWRSGLLSVAIGGITIPGQATYSKVVDSMTWITGTGVGTTTGLTNERLYSFSLTAETAEIGPSAEVLATPGTASTDTESGGAAATNVTATVTTGTTGQVTISWIPLASETPYTSYNLYYYPNPAGSPTIKIPGATSPWTASGLTDGTSYSFYLTSDTASSISFSTLATPSANPPPAAPVLEPATVVGAEVTLTWSAVTAVPAVTSYNIYVGTAMGVTKDTGAPSPVADGSLTTTATLPTGTYYIVVTAINANALESTESNEISVTVP